MRSFIMMVVGLMVLCCGSGVMKGQIYDHNLRIEAVQVYAKNGEVFFMSREGNGIGRLTPEKGVCDANLQYLIKDKKAQVCTFAVVEGALLVTAEIEGAEPRVYRIDIESGEQEILTPAEFLGTDELLMCMRKLRIYQPEAYSNKLVATVTDKRDLCIVLFSQDGGKTWSESSEAFANEVHRITWVNDSEIIGMKIWQSAIAGIKKMTLISSAGGLWMRELDSMLINADVPWFVGKSKFGIDIHPLERYLLVSDPFNPFTLRKQPEGGVQYFKLDVYSKEAYCRRIGFWETGKRYLDDYKVWMVTTSANEPVALVSDDMFETYTVVGSELGLPEKSDSSVVDGWCIEGDMMYAHTYGGQLVTLDLKSAMAGVSEVEADDASAEGPAEYYNLQGQRVSEPTPGLYIVRRGGVTTKEVVK